MNERFGVYDVNVNGYPRLLGETGDSVRIMRAAGNCSGGILYKHPDKDSWKCRPGNDHKFFVFGIL